jgi:hypothetical protein
MRTLQSWLNAHPHVNVLAFEKNYAQQRGFGAEEEVCGFCLASHFFDSEPPEYCGLCRAPLRDSHAISDLREIVARRYELRLFPAEQKHVRPLPFVVRKYERL